MNLNSCLFVFTSSTVNIMLCFVLALLLLLSAKTRPTKAYPVAKASSTYVPVNIFHIHYTLGGIWIIWTRLWRALTTASHRRGFVRRIISRIMMTHRHKICMNSICVYWWCKTIHPNVITRKSLVLLLVASCIHHAKSRHKVQPDIRKLWQCNWDVRCARLQKRVPWKLSLGRRLVLRGTICSDAHCWKKLHVWEKIRYGISHVIWLACNRFCCFVHRCCLLLFTSNRCNRSIWFWMLVGPSFVGLFVILSLGIFNFYKGCGLFQWVVDFLVYNTKKKGLIIVIMSNTC